MDLTRELDVAASLCRRAGDIILRYRQPGLTVSRKAGDEPVTVADREANALIVADLRATFPADGILSEEGAEVGAHEGGGRVWMVDPLDGTRDYVAGREGFAVMIGLCIDGRPSLGVVYQPLRTVLYRAVAGAGAAVEADGRTRPLRVSAVGDPSAARLISSASHRLAKLDELRTALGISDEVSLGSVGLKVGLIATGERDLYVNPEGATKLWDTCAPEAILAEAGGRLTDLGGQPIDYRGADIRNRRGLIATNSLLHPAVVPVAAQLLPV
ncbi:MAG TPA: 3'(2'),5'-bisphosphate nucleotidase CysQ [Polyangia bacterium]|jgi:3'(2'),5'-bisphosphate nucleotidase